MNRIFLKRGKEESLARRHPWIFSGAIERIEGDPEEGDVVDVYARSGEFLARGHYQIGSITVRVLSFEQEEIDAAWWEARLRAAWAVRRAIGLIDSPDTDCYRLVHGEGDNLPGLVIDIYGDVAVVQAHSVGMYRSRQAICEALRTVYGDRLAAVYDKSAQTLPYMAETGAVDGYLYGGGASTERIVTEHGNRFHVDWGVGQKTGFFLDQRENRALVGHYSAGRTVLNTFSYTGGFSVYALAGGAREVVSVDSSATAVALAVRNAELNFGPDVHHEGVASDVFDYLKTTDKQFDLIILDPPAFAKHHKVLGNATKGYTRLNARALSQIAPGGILFYLQLFAGGQPRTVPHDGLHGGGHCGTPGAHPAPAHPAGRPSGEHLPPRGRIPQGPGAVCGIGRRCAVTICSGEPPFAGRLPVLLLGAGRVIVG